MNVRFEVLFGDLNFQGCATLVYACNCVSDAQAYKIMLFFHDLGIMVIKFVLMLCKHLHQHIVSSTVNHLLSRLYKLVTLDGFHALHDVQVGTLPACIVLLGKSRLRKFNARHKIA